ncbi:ABC transporter permease [Mucilaginibacter sp. KACC 22063]|uniref:ABC transporter permease n=1 Tax=Mucilaginibacter sp. KACC 22063 TaxID=3025666 RepID=UPI00236657D4|nr:ABC transporter permease [Mucilaginibacter sp. KACC 22063]WDF53437.1 ABC transporter permease [Mucilaginibacter sp. KACC 22063]
MLYNYFKTTIRSFKNNLLFSLINIVGLSIGISAALVIYLIVNHDLTFDKFHPDGNRIYRVVTTMRFANFSSNTAAVPLPLQDAAGQELTGMEATAPFVLGEETKAAIQTPSEKSKVFKKQPDIVYTDSRYFNCFKYKWLAGSPKSLNEPNKVVLSASRAKLYFNAVNPQDAIGKLIVYNDSVKTTVVGVIADFIENTDFTFKDFISLKTGFPSGMNLNNWTNTDGKVQLFLKLKENATTENIEKQIQSIYAKNVKSDVGHAKFKLQPLSDIHFNNAFGVFGHRQANTKALYGLLAVGGIILLLACINFVNLTTAQAVNRAREIGVRKTLGGSKSQLIFQFFSETIVITSIAAILSLLLVPFLLKMFSDFIPPELHFNILQQPGVIIFTIVLIGVVGLISGIYPALVLASYNPVTALKNQVAANGKGRNVLLRQSLTVVQFIAAQVLIIGTIIVSKQIHYMLNKDLGFDKNGIVIIDLPYKNHNNDVFQDQIKSLPQVDQAVLAGPPPARNGYSMTSLNYNNGKNKIELSPEVKQGDESYFKFYHIKLLAGKYLQLSDSLHAIVVNESFVKALGFQHPQEGIGATINIWNRQMQIAGVVSNFNSSSLHVAIAPLIFNAEKDNFYTLHIKFKPGTTADNVSSAITAIRGQWQKLYPDVDFEYNFLDEQIARFYESEQNTARLLTWATDIAIFISCMGLLGLVIHTTAQRTKEIGVRKVLGASVSRIVALLSYDFLKLVIIAIVIASPLAWYGVSKWMQGFAYHTPINWWSFVLAGLIAIIVALFTISFNAVKAALANPVKSLRSE